MTRPAASLYRYTPGEKGSVLTFSRSSMEGRYNLIMSRWIAALAVFCAVPLIAQDKPELKRRDGKTTPSTKQEAKPPEEDKSLSTPEYGFNPVQAQKEIRTGDYYFK